MRTLTASLNTVRIGQKEDCQVRLPNSGIYADEVFAVIKPVKSLEEWEIIPVSPFVKSFVNGCEVGLNHYLKSGDIISFSEGDEEIKFEVKKSALQGASSQAGLSRKGIAAMYIAAALLVVLAFYGVLSQSIKQRHTNAALSRAEESVYLLKTDSVFMVRRTGAEETVVRRAAAFGHGTAFLTTEGLLVTARHCIEPWLNYNKIYESPDSLNCLPVPMSWALEAETFNQTSANDTTYALISLCRIYDRSGELLTEVLSSAFSYDNSRDEIIELGSYSKASYWRSIAGRFGRSDMMLGDIAVLSNLGRKGSIELLPTQKAPGVLKRGRKLIINGYPTRQTGVNLEIKACEVLQDYVPGTMLQHSGGIEPGYSGGPALVVLRGIPYAVSVVSTFDQNSRNCVYSTPITQIDHVQL